MNEIVACYVVCNEADVITESIRSVKAYVDRFLFHDVVFKGNPRPGTHSSDNTKEVARAACHPLPCTYVESLVWGVSQGAARNEYLNRAEGVAFVLDADEIMVGDHEDVGALFEWLREDDGPKAVTIPVYTTAAMVKGWGKDIPREIYERAALIHTKGHMPRFIRTDAGYRYREDEKIFSAGLWNAKGELLRGEEEKSVFLINRRALRPFDSYIDSCFWTMGSRGLL